MVKAMNKKTLSKILVCIICFNIFLCLILLARRERSASRIKKSPSSVEQVIQNQKNKESEKDISYEPDQLLQSSNDSTDESAGLTETEPAAVEAAPAAEDDSGKSFGKIVLAENIKDVAAYKASKPLPKAPEKIDIDLTKLTGNMIYLQVLDMVNTPEKFEGKTVKMEGMMGSYHDEVDQTYYFGCVIQDATACCSQGLEFKLTDWYVYPQDYPADSEQIKVIGTFTTYYDGGNKYITLKDAILTD